MLGTFMINGSLSQSRQVQGGLWALTPQPCLTPGPAAPPVRPHYSAACLFSPVDEGTILESQNGQGQAKLKAH